MDRHLCQFRNAWVSFKQNLFNRLEQSQVSCWLLHYGIAKSPKGSFIAVRIPSLACGVQTVAFPRSYCLLKSLFIGWSKSLQEILCWRRKFGLFASCLASLLCGASRVGCDQVACPCIAKCSFFFHHLKKSSVLHYTAPDIEARTPCDWTEFGLFLAVSHLLMLLLLQLQS